MKVWHLTPETPREPSRVTPGLPMHLHIGTWPIEPGQEVTVELSITSWSGRMADGHAPINFSPVLLWQLEDYLERGRTDRALQLTCKRTSCLTSAERRELLETFFDAHWHHQIYPYPRYRALLEQGVPGQRFPIQDFTDLKMWFNLSWFHDESRTGTVILSDGTTVSVQWFIEQGMQFTQRDIEAILAEQDKLLCSILPLHRQLQEQGQIEVSGTRYGHPVLPLLMDTDLATPDRAGATLPARFAYPEDAGAHVAMAVARYREWFGCEPWGMWPAEGSVMEAVVSLFARHGIRWIATDEGVLARSGRYGYRVEDPNGLCQPYQALIHEGEGAVSVLFRNRQLSDAIPFHHQSFPDPEQAPQSSFAAVKARVLCLQGERDFLVSVILDGENA